MKAQHERAGKRPGLGGVVPHAVHFDSGLFPDLPRHGVLGAFAGFHIPGQSGIDARFPCGLASKQTAVPVVDENDDGRIDPGKMLPAAARIGTDPALGI